MPLAIAHGSPTLQVYSLLGDLSPGDPPAPAPAGQAKAPPANPAKAPGDSGKAPADSGKDAQNKPLTQFAQEVQSSVKNLSLQPGEVTRVPITIRNVGREPWGIGGKYPIMLSYRWWSGGKMLPQEGRRTARTRVLLPGESDQISAEVQALGDRGKYILRFSLVQESVAWFFPSGGALDVPVTVR
jgi:hypothetical protein